MLQKEFFKNDTNHDDIYLFAPTASIEVLVDQEYQTDADVDPCNPLLEREFGEVIIRCMIDSAVRNGMTENIYNTIFKILSEKVHYIYNIYIIIIL